MARWKKPKKKSIDHDGTPSAELLEGLAPAQAAGMTEGLTAEEYFERFPAEGAVDQISHLKGKTKDVAGTRVPAPTFVVENDPTSIWTDGTDRIQMGHNATFPKETLDAMQAGYICIQCYEPNLEPFPLSCSLCGYPMKERQIIDFAMQFEGAKWLGPTKAAQEYLADLEERAERKRFDQKIAAGASKMKGLVRRG